ncbi:MAG: hypothetical protein GX421_02945 [Caldisericales bacterium]|nr:hypothetical protein [Caldisericales bacterium]
MPAGDIVHLEFYTTDFEKFKKFYAPFNWKFTDWGEDYMLFMPPNEQGIGGGIMKSQKPMPNQNMFPYIIVGDINVELPKLKEIGWEIVEGKMPITGVGFFAVLKDFDGNTINLFESLPRQQS